MNDTIKRGFNILSQRSAWETQQRYFTQMRTDGIRRTNKPFPTAADLHFPLVDMTIGDLKPFWMAQMFGGDRISDFMPLKQDLAPMAESAADYFDFKLRYDTSEPLLRYVAEQMVDTMLHRGRGVLMGTLDPYNNWAITLKNIDPQYLLMKQQFDDFWDADSWIWVQRLSVGQYKRDKNYNQTPETINKIKGQKDYQFSSIELVKQMIEGVTHSNDADQIILWHEYERLPSGDIQVSVTSPMADEVNDIRAPYKVPYEIGGRTSCPFHSFTMEILGSGGWYAPRGIARLNAAFEAYLCKCWNEDADSMTFLNRPLFTGQNAMDSTANWDFFPGSYVPGNVQAVQMGQPPVSFMERINFGRALSERRSRTPDFGQFSPEDTGGKPITATQSKITAGLQAVGADHNGDTFRNIRLLSFYKHLWSLMLHANKCQMNAAQVNKSTPPQLLYLVSDDLKELPVQALAESYLVIPAGGSANKEIRQQRATARFGLLKGAPNIDQDELTRGLIAADDARLVKKLLIPQNEKQQDEAADESVELMVMEKGRPFPVKAGQDHATRIIECASYLHAQEMQGKPVNPAAVTIIKQHMAMHMQYLKQTQPAAVKQVMATIQQIEEAPAPGKVVGMPQQGQQPQLPQGQPQEASQ